jgi:hypothetical protein
MMPIKEEEIKKPTLTLKKMTTPKVFLFMSVFHVSALTISLPGLLISSTVAGPVDALRQIEKIVPTHTLQSTLELPLRG